jgi:hypothetical protein
MPAIWYLRQNFRELAELPVPPKPLACSWVTSTIQRCEGHRVRLAFLDQLRREVDFDLYGRGTDLERGGFGELSAKSHGLEPYRYTVVVENYWQNQWYVSEKLWDALLCWCLPLYYGGPAADRLMPEGSFLRIPSLDDAGIRFVKETIASPHHWQQALPKIREARERVLRELNLLNWLSNRIAG